MVLVGLLAVGLAASVPLARWVRPADLIPSRPADALALDDVHVVPMRADGDDVVLERRQLLIEGGEVVAIRPAGSPVEPPFRRVAGGGAYVVPGLVDMHTHVLDRKYLAMSLAHGVTSVRNLSGYPMHLRWKRELERGEWLGSRLFTTAPVLNGERFYDPLAHQLVTDTTHARALVRRYAEEGWDGVKVYAGLAPDVYGAIVDEAGRRGLPVAAHVPHAVYAGGDLRSLASVATVEHAEDLYQGPLGHRFDDDRLDAVARDLAARGATVTPTLMIVDHLTQIGSRKEAYLSTLPVDAVNPLVRRVTDRTSGARWLGVSDEERAHNERLNRYLRHVVRVLHEHGVTLVAGSDAGAIYSVPGPTLHIEMALMREAGLTPYEVLRSATTNAAHALGVGDRLGSVRPGAVADLVVVRGNPLEDLGALEAPVAVVRGGQWLGRSDLDALEASAHRPSNAYLTLGRVLEFVLSKE